MFFIGALLIFAGYNGSIWRNERVLEDGTVVRLALAPIDPRAFLTGDFMALNYDLSGQIAIRPRKDSASGAGRGGSDKRSTLNHDEIAIVSLDEKRIARLVRVQSGLTPLEAGEVALQVRLRGGRAALGTNAWYFQEGTGARFRAAKFGEFRVAPDGRMLLGAMLDAQLQPIQDAGSSGN